MTDLEIINTANRLAGELSLASGWKWPKGFRFDRPDPHWEKYEATGGKHPRAAQAWELARIAFAVLLDTDIDDAVTICDDEYHEPVGSCDNCECDIYEDEVDEDGALCD